MRAAVATSIVAVSLAACVQARPASSMPNEKEAAPAAAAAYAELGDVLRADAELASVLGDAERRRVQVLVAIPDEASHTVERRAFRVDAEYFYPASAVKLCVAAAVLEKLDELRSERADLSLSTPLRVTSVAERSPLDTTLRDEIERMLVVSDNDAYNRLFDFVGAQELAGRLRTMGLQEARVVHHLGDARDDVAPPAFELLGGGRPLLVAQRIGIDPAPPRSELLGSAHVDADGRRVEGPLDFGEKNRVSLRELQDLLVAIVRPDLSELPAPRWANADRESMVAILGTLPSELSPNAPRALDDFHKPLSAAVKGALPGHDVRVYGKGGRAYGFTVENSYVVDATSKRSVFVAATIYANDNETLNDDRYEYASVSDPFVARLGVVIARAFLP